VDQSRVAPHQLRFEIAIRKIRGVSTAPSSGYEVSGRERKCMPSLQSQEGAFLLSLSRRTAIVRATD